MFNAKVVADELVWNGLGEGYYANWSSQIAFTSATCKADEPASRVETRNVYIKMSKYFPTDSFVNVWE